MHRRSCRLAYLTTLAALPLLAGCADGGATGTSAVVLTLVPVAVDVSTHQLTRASVRGGQLAVESYAGAIGGASFTARRVNDSTLAFVVPALPAGQHQMTISIGESVATAMLRVAVTPDVADPVALASAIAASFEARVSAAQQSVTRAGSGGVAVDQARFALDIGKAHASIDSARIAFAALSPVEQQEAAKLLKATFGAAAGGSASSGGPGGGLLLTGVPGPEYCETPLLLTVEETERCREAAAQELLASDVSDCDAEAAEAASRGFSARNRNFVWHLFNGCHYASLTQFSAEAWEAVQWPTMPDLDEVVTEIFTPSASPHPGAAEGAEASNVAAPISFVPGVPRVIAPGVRFRPMTASDVGKVPAATQTAQLLTSIAAKWNRLNTLVGRILGQAPPTVDQLTSVTSRKLTYPASRLRLGTITPATVRGNAVVSNGRWALTFDIDDKTQPTPFTFDIIYNGGQYGADTMRVAGVLGDSLSIYEGAILGRWTRTYLIDGSSHTVDFRAANKVAAHIVPPQVHLGQSYCSSGTKVGDVCEIYTPWRVYRENGRYYLLDGTAADYGTRDPLTIPVTGYTNYYQGTAQFRFTKQ